MGHRTWSEPDVIKLFSTQKPTGGTGLIAGIGDDCAIIRPSAKRDYLVTADMLVDQVHFDLSFHPPYYLGRKCMAVNLSDVAAMGGKPEFALLSLAIPNDFEEHWLNEFSDGIDSILREFNCTLIGGDTVSGRTFTCSVTMLGSVQEDRAILRSNAQPGDSVYVSGELGFAAAGLAMCQNQKRFGSIETLVEDRFVQQHLNPTPDVECSRILTASGLITSMQDLSDGLATDLAHICESSDVGALVQAESLPGLSELRPVCAVLGEPAIELQISGGEDYHLIFTVTGGQESQLEAFMSQSTTQKIYRIGTIVNATGVRLKTGDSEMDITFRGYSHGS